MQKTPEQLNKLVLILVVAMLLVLTILGELKLSNHVNENVVEIVILGFASLKLTNMAFLLSISFYSILSYFI